MEDVTALFHRTAMCTRSFRQKLRAITLFTFSKRLVHAGVGNSQVFLVRMLLQLALIAGITHKRTPTAFITSTSTAKRTKKRFIPLIPMLQITLASIPPSATISTMRATQTMLFFLLSLAVHPEGQRKGGFVEQMKVVTTQNGFFAQSVPEPSPLE